MKLIDAGNRRAIAKLLARQTHVDAQVERRVRTIVERVRTGGDRALIAYAKNLDGLTTSLEVPQEDLARAAATLDPGVRTAIRQAAQNIARVAFRQIPGHFDLQVAPGVSVEQRIEPLDRVGCYVPAGRFPLPSSLLMTAVPARVAGVREVYVACPRPDAVIMAAAHEAGVTKLFRMGGAHAVAAMAFGTSTVPCVDKIVGPGNRYVAAAKAQVARECAIDFYAGPTEIVVVAGAGRPEWAAADLVAQAEHDPDARAVLITWRRSFAVAVARATTRMTAAAPVARRSLNANGAIVVVGGEDDAVSLANRLAPEHLVLEREALARRPLTAGAVFIGPYTAQALGDYATGSNHVLPTASAARFRGGLNAADFVRVMAVQRVTREGVARLAPIAVPLARAEGLEAHARSIELRLKRS
jgi:histidinol dehydrogenase